MSRKNERHGLSESSEYIAWSCMIDRCNNPRNKRFKDYGGRGISVCAAWQDSFLQFLADVGRKPSSSMSLDRINNDGNYEPGNVRWAEPKTQAANRRTNHLLTLEGVTKSVSEWAREKGVNRSVIFSRLASGWPQDRLFDSAFSYTEKHQEYVRRKLSERTHCSAGHELTPENTYHKIGNGRICRICQKARAAAYNKIRAPRNRRNRQRKAAVA